MTDIIKQPRFWLLVWGGLGALFLLYFIVNASLGPSGPSEPSALDHDQALLVGEMADFTYTFPPRGASDVGFDHNGEPMTLADFRGKAVLVNFWATTCAPCLVELPSLDQLEGDLGGQRFEVVAVAADPRGPETAQQFLDRLEIKNLKLYADANLQFAFSVGGADVLPTSILYSASGEEVGRIVGEADWASPEARRLIASAMP
ncbi:redoxin family protein [Hyphococcus flavus]|uniref:Redoxin family protein n=1 Tax=Hyphococcus flavus TaxID=1866326 RepID=A0AAE9ZKZ5_9PROT|nr:TlpA family protein disulfide reductase [Hyphococcus flavus]WDI33066.1 redoxin family protein [Hyphococcus flavus]